MNILETIQKNTQDSGDALKVIHLTGRSVGPDSPAAFKVRIKHGGLEFLTTWRQVQKDIADRVTPPLSAKARRNFAERMDHATFGRDVDLAGDVADAIRRTLIRCSIVKEIGWVGPQFDSLKHVKEWTKGSRKVTLQGKEVVAPQDAESFFEERAEVERKQRVNEDQPDEPAQWAKVEKVIALSDLKEGWVVVRKFFGFTDGYFMPGQSESGKEALDNILNTQDVATQAFVGRWLWEMNAKAEKDEDRKNSASGAPSTQGGQASRKAKGSS